MCLKLELNPGQKPRPAMISPSGLRELWLLPIVAPAAMFDCPKTVVAIRNDELWCCSWKGKIRLFKSSQQDTVELSPKIEFKRRAPYLSWQFRPITKRTATA